MMDLIKKLIELAYYYRTDEAAGKPYWQDPTVIGLVVSLIGIALARAAGITLDADLQLKIVGVITGIGALLSPHTGVVAKAASPPTHPYPGPSAPTTDARAQAAEAAKAVQEHNLSNLS